MPRTSWASPRTTCAALRSTVSRAGCRSSACRWRPSLPERPGLPRRALAELLAAFALIFCVGGAAAAEGSGHAALGLPAQAAVSGLAIMGLIYAVGHLSGAHINPAVTLAFTVTRHFPSREALAYIVAQLVGAALAGLLLLAVWPDRAGNLGANAIGI